MNQFFIITPDSIQDMDIVNALSKYTARITVPNSIKFDISGITEEEFNQLRWLFHTKDYDYHYVVEDSKTHAISYQDGRTRKSYDIGGVAI